MAKTIDERLAQLESRRSGMDRLTALAQDSKYEVLAKSLVEESYKKRARAMPYTQYALGAMQEVDQDYTRISLEEATRVGKQLKTGLTSAGVDVDFRLQGSVAANIHIRGVSDVDLLVLNNAFFTYDVNGPRSRAGHFNSPISYTPLSALQFLRTHSESILSEKFPAADVDVDGAKAIKISGGSLRRPVDVVPSHWHDSRDYQASFLERDRGVCILDKRQQQSILNMPFRHIDELRQRDELTLFGLKKSIRLCKHVKADSEEDSIDGLPSFDIAAAMWHADLGGLLAGYLHELAILAETQRHLDVLARNHDFAKTLLVPDGSRRIFDSNSKLQALNQLSIEMDELALQVSKEQNPIFLFYQPSWSEVIQTLKSATVPAG
ncbi:hypothetical protein B0G76_8358 [Paraburkholderia sp. BL23I1N1]|uniref:hypothetical protein n=1 Tax=Paraburkholderia sp. BL23I1N1 TaxID=1938802 RepID=UPI000E71F871|nr:hypothetical protein [Paraburkholderia sp. BL23I1N1]RKE24470.1 hypothetical protein B0G76_8358 [Paraburkholderia sp. BL23I1N1]